MTEKHMHSDPQNHADHEKKEHEKHERDAEHEKKAHNEHDQHAGAGPSHHEQMVADYRKRFWVALILTVPILILSPLIQEVLGFGDSLRFRGDTLLLFGLSSILFFYGGKPFLKGFAKEIKSAKPGMMTLVSVAIITAYVYSTAVVFGLEGKMFFWELATLIDVMLLGHWIEMRSIMGASRALEELAKLMPSKAHLLMPDGTIHDVSLDKLNVGDNVLIKPGEKIPADGKIIEGQTSINEAMLTGESKPLSKSIGDQAIGGSINGEGSVTIKIRKTGKESFLNQVINLVKEAQASKSKSQDFADRAAMYLTFIGIGAGIITLIVWLAILNESFAFAIERTVTVVVITCPHALGLAIPLVVAVSTAISARNGLLIRNRNSFERARKIKAIIFDKTGTLTEGKFGITDTLVFDDNLSESELIKYAASVETRSEHPIAKAIADKSPDLFQIKDFKAIPGKGAQGEINNKLVKIVSPGYLRQENIATDNKRFEKLFQQGKTVVFVLIDDKVAGAIALADIIRPESKKAISMLKNMGIKAMMLTGDNKQVAEWVSSELGLDEYFAEVLPQEKSAKVKEVQARGITVAMTGDGVNDAPALAQADVGIAIGAGTDVAVETADVVLVNSNPIDAVAVINLSRATYKKMVQNLAWATGYNVFAIPIAAGVLYSYGILLSPASGAALMSLSTIIVAINARFLKIKK